MRTTLWGCAALAVAACGGDDGATPVDEPTSDSAATDATTDAMIDAMLDAPTCPRTIFDGGADPAAQGWMVNAGQPATLTHDDTVTLMQTSTPAGALTGGYQLLYKPGVVTPGQPFAVRVTLQVDAVNAHNPFDAGVAILGAYGAPFGTAVDRQQMIYLDAGRIGWGDDTQSHAVVTTGTFRDYVLAVDAAGTATVTVDGVAALSRGGFVTDGAIAIGDQTNDPNVDSTLRVRSVVLLCP